MFDMFNPAMREAKRRAREEYRQRMLQGKMDATVRHARERADKNLAFQEKMHVEVPKFLKNAAFVFGVFMFLVWINS